MNVLHIITRLIVGGAQENTLLTCEGLRARGHSVTLLTGPSPGPEGSLMERARAGGYRVILTPHLVRAPHPVHDWSAYREIKRLVRELAPDVVHTHSSKAGVIGRAAAWRVKTQNAKRKTQNVVRSGPHESPPPAPRPLVVHTIHGLPFHPYQNRLVNRAWIVAERFAARRCDAIICVADAMTRQALAAGVGRPEMFTTIYSAMETGPYLDPGVSRAAVRAGLGIPPAAFVFGTIARLQPLKGHDDLLAFAGELFGQVPDAHLLWIGDGIFRPRIEALLREKNWSQRVTLTGLVPPEQVPRLLPAMDVLVHPSYREGLARALPQALLAGVPVISYDCDGAAEVCIGSPPQQTGLLVKTGDARALLAAMLRMARQREDATIMGACGRELCRRRFAAEAMVEQIESLYANLAAAGTRPGTGAPDGNPGL